MHHERDCVFCKIARGDTPCHKIHEDESTLAFLDIFPVADGHVLIVTKEHFESIFDTPAGALKDAAATAKRVADAMRRALAPEGVGIFQLNGAAAGQTVFHYHVHLVPRATGEPLKLHSRVRGDEERLREVAAKLRSALGGE